MSTDILQDDPATFGHFRKPKTYLLGPLGTLSSVFVFAALIGGVILLLVSKSILSTFIYSLIAGVFVLNLILKDRHDLSRFERAGTKTTWWITKLKRENIYRSGPLTTLGTCVLPGLAAKTTLTDEVDSLGRPFALLEFNGAALYSVPIRNSPAGSSLHDPFDLETMTARWSRFLAIAAQEQNLVQLMVTVQTSPDHGVSLREEIDTMIRPDAPDLVKKIFSEQIREEYPAGASKGQTWTTFTYSGTGRKKRDRAQMKKLLASRIPALTSKLAATGAGSSTPMESFELAEVIRVAYNPADGVAIAKNKSNGVDRGLVCQWDNVGPMAHQTEWDCYRHDSGLSVTWVATGIRGDMLASSLQPLLEAHEDIDIKRVSIIYTPKSPDKSAITAEKDKKNANYRVKGKENPSARAEKEAVATNVVAKDEAKGAALIDFTIIFTATVMNTDNLSDAMAAIDTLAPTARLQHRIAYGTQDSSFAQNLPLGIVARAHSKVPAAIREAI